MGSVCDIVSRAGEVCLQAFKETRIFKTAQLQYIVYNYIGCSQLKGDKSQTDGGKLRVGGILGEYNRKPKRCAIGWDKTEFSHLFIRARQSWSRVLVLTGTFDNKSTAALLMEWRRRAGCSDGKWGSPEYQCKDNHGYSRDYGSL